MKSARLALRAGVSALALLLIDQACDRFLLADRFFLGRPVAPFDPPLFSPAQRAALERIETQLAAGESVEHLRFDPELGWCNKPGSGSGDFRYDWAGARIGLEPLAREKRSGVRRIVAIGCSMTHGDEVGPRGSWCARVDEALPEVELANLGVAAYGIDQALLRLRRDGPALDADEVWLGLLPAAALRVTTLYRPLLDHWSLDVAFKPRFALGPQGGLERIPCPAPRFDDIPRLLGDQRAFIQALAGHDPWVERAPLAYAPRGSHWTHRLFTTRLVLTLLEGGGRAPEPCFGDPPGEFGRLFTAIVRATAEEARSQGTSFRLLVLPGREELLDRLRHGRGYWEDWAGRLESGGISVLDASGFLLREDALREELFEPHGHYSREGNRLVAEFLLERLRREAEGR